MEARPTRCRIFLPQHRVIKSAHMESCIGARHGDGEVLGSGPAREPACWTRDSCDDFFRLDVHRYWDAAVSPLGAHAGALYGVLPAHRPIAWHVHPESSPHCWAVHTKCAAQQWYLQRDLTSVWLQLCVQLQYTYYHIVHMYGHGSGHTAVPIRYLKLLHSVQPCTDTV